MGTMGHTPRVRFIGTLPLYVYFKVLSHFIPELDWKKIEYCEVGGFGGGHINDYEVTVTTNNIFVPQLAAIEQIRSWYYKGRGNELLRINYEG